MNHHFKKTVLSIVAGLVVLLMSLTNIYADGSATKQTNVAYTLGVGSYVVDTAYYYNWGSWTTGVPVAYKYSGNALQVMASSSVVNQNNAITGGFLTMSYTIAVTDAYYNVGYAYPNNLKWITKYGSVY